MLYFTGINCGLFSRRSLCCNYSRSLLYLTHIDCTLFYTYWLYSILQAFTIEGDQVHSVPSLRYYSNNNTHARFLTSNTEQDIHRLQGELTQLRQEIQKKEQVKVTVRDNLRQNQSEEKKCETQLMKIGQRLNKLNNVRGCLGSQRCFI